MRLLLRILSKKGITELALPHLLTMRDNFKIVVNKKPPHHYL